MAWKIRSGSRRDVSVRERNLDLFDSPFGGLYAFYTTVAT